MERITVKISISTDRCFPASEDRRWLQDTFDISYKRAESLRERLYEARSQGCILELTHEQLARYVAKRQLEGLNKHFRWPEVLEYIEHEEDPVDPVIELRPTKRCVP